MRPDEPSLTALGVAAARASLERPATPTGDPAADRALAASLLAARATDPRHGDREGEPTLFLLEGVLRYLPEHWFRALLATLAERSAEGSELAVSISTRPPGEDGDPPDRELERRRRLAELGEPVLTVPERAVALRWLAEAGWDPTSVVDVAEQRPGARPGRLLVSARPRSASEG